MDPSLLIPSPDSVPVHWGWLRGFLLFTFVVHILIMNTMLGSAIISMVNSFRNKPDRFAVERQISRNLPYTIAFTINTGVAPLLFVQVLYGQFVYTSSILMAGYWLSTVLFVMAAYYLAYIHDFKFEALGTARKYVTALTVLLLLFTAFIFSNNFTLMLSPGKWFEYFNNTNGTILNVTDPVLYPRFLHFVTGSIAVGGLILALYNKYIDKNETSRRKIATGLKWFNYATITQMIIGIWFLISLPGDVRMLFMGNNTLATTLLIAGVVSGLLSLILGFKARVLSCASTAVLTIGIMAVMREFLKSAYLKPFFSIKSLQIEAQYTPLIMFLAVLVLGFLGIGYMLKLVRQQTGEDSI